MNRYLMLFIMLFVSSCSDVAKNTDQYCTLNNGVKIPLLGFGVYEIDDYSVCKRSVMDALKAGYRSIDTAAFYNNEKAVGDAIKEFCAQYNVDRNEIFVTTKIWITADGYKETKDAFKRCLERLGLEYVDMLLLHWPWGNLKENWEALEDLYEEGNVKVIGVCNCSPKYIKEILSFAKIKPAVNQVECHPLFQQNELRDILDKENIKLESWSPLCRNQENILKNFLLEKIAEKYKKTTAQVILRWHIQEGFVVIPRSSNINHIKNNFYIWDFCLSEEEVNTIRGMNINKRLFFTPEGKGIEEFARSLPFSG